jgi:deoxyhypusine synthase
MQKAYRWQLIEQKVNQEAQIQVNDEDLKAEAYHKMKDSLMQYGSMNLPEETLRPMAERLLEDEKEVRDIYQRVLQKKAMTELKSRFGVKEVVVSLEEFRSQQ